MCAVTVKIHNRLTHKTRTDYRATGEVGVAEVHPGIEHRNLDTDAAT
jgi:hypothetical protein